MNAKFSQKIGFLFLIFAILVTSLNVNVTPARAASAPTLVSPANDLTTTVANYPPLAIPEFKWNAVAGATMYRIQVSTDEAFTNFIVNETTPHTRYTPIASKDFADTNFFWRVRVESPTPASSYSVRSFTKAWSSGNAPTLIAPANASAVDFYDAPTFSWSPVVGVCAPAVNRDDGAAGFFQRRPCRVKLGLAMRVGLRDTHPVASPCRVAATSLLRS